jgi:hypothetical protein
MFVMRAFGSLFANMKEVKGRGPEPMKAIDNGVLVDIEVGDDEYCDKVVRMFESSRLQRST